MRVVVGVGVWIVSARWMLDRNAGDGEEVAEGGWKVNGKGGRDGGMDDCGFVDDGGEEAPPPTPK